MDSEADMLPFCGHIVHKYKSKNSEALDRGFSKKLRVFWDAAWSTNGYEIISHEIRKFGPDVMHVHSYWLMLSPSIFKAAYEMGVATVCTLHHLATTEFKTISTKP